MNIKFYLVTHIKFDFVVKSVFGIIEQCSQMSLEQLIKLSDAKRSDFKNMKDCEFMRLKKKAITALKIHYETELAKYYMLKINHYAKKIEILTKTKKTSHEKQHKRPQKIVTFFEEKKQRRKDLKRCVNPWKSKTLSAQKAWKKASHCEKLDMAIPYRREQDICDDSKPHPRKTVAQLDDEIDIYMGRK